jgi:hypothetical protein
MQDAYIHALPASRALYERARKLFPDAVTRDNRRMQPFPMYVERADGARPTGSCASMVRSGGKARKSLPRQRGFSLVSMLVCSVGRGAPNLRDTARATPLRQ